MRTRRKDDEIQFNSLSCVRVQWSNIKLFNDLMSNTEESVLSATVVCGIFETDD